MSQFDFDLLVVGGGSGGVRLARWSGGLGAKVAIVERDRFGGTCVIRGCIPKKMMSLGAHLPEELEVMHSYGWRTGIPEIDFQFFKDAREKEISRLSGLYSGMLEKTNVTQINGEAKLTGPNTIEVDGKEYSAQKIAIAVGGEPYCPNIPGADLAMVSDDVFKLGKVPKSMLVIGGGYIGLEFASVFNGFGSDVQVACRRDMILAGFDRDLREFLKIEMEKKGVRIHCNTQATKIEKIDSRYKVTLSTGEPVEVETVLMATGRVPRTATLGLGSVGVKTKENGAIVVDDNYQTSVPSIYALGDCTDQVNLTPVATAEGTVLAEALFGKGERKMSYDDIPTAVFSHPTLSAVGLSEEDAKDQYGDIEVFKSDFRNLKFTLGEGGERTLMKMVVDKKTQKVLGCHMVGMDAPEVIQGMAVAIKAGATKAVFDSTIGIHPTSAEEFVTMR